MTFTRPSPAEQQERNAARRSANLQALATATLRPVTVGSYGGTTAGPVPKENPVRDEPYRRLVATLPCKNCGIAGYSQAAHPNTGKGAGTKASDSDCFPLCCDRPGVRVCHSAFDQGALFSKAARRAIEQAWAADTRRQLGIEGGTE